MVYPIYYNSEWMYCDQATEYYGSSIVGMPCKLTMLIAISPVVVIQIGVHFFASSKHQMQILAQNQALITKQHMHVIV